MQKNPSQNKIRTKPLILSIAVILLLLLNTGYTVQVAAQSAETVERDPQTLLDSVPQFDRKIAIVHSSNDFQVNDIASGISQFMGPFYQPVDLFEVSSLDWSMLDSSYWVIIHVYDTNIYGPVIGQNSYSWADLAGAIQQHNDKHHVLGIANTKQATSGLGGAIQHASLVDNQTEVTDGKLVALNAVWLAGNYIADHAPSAMYLDAADQMRGLVVKYFSENINEMVERSYEPLNPMGQQDTVAAQLRFDKLMEQSPKTANYINTDGISIPLLQAVQQQLINKNDYSLVLNNFESDLTIAEIPTKTGIEGPAGSVLDTLLSILVNFVQFVELSPDVANQINEIMKYIPKVLGIIEDPSVQNILTLALDILVQRFPRVNEYRNYIEIALKGFDALRQGPTEIIAFALDLVKEFFPDNSTIVFIAEEILNDNLVQLIEDISSGENVFTAVLTWISNLVLDNFLDQIFTSWLGFDLSKVFSVAQTLNLNALNALDTEAETGISFIGRIKAVLSSLLKAFLRLFQSQDATEFIEEVVPELIFEELIPNLYPLIGRTIVIDPGHGGRYPGAVGTFANGTQIEEKKLALLVSFDLRDALENLGATVVMTRTTDTTLNPGCTGSGCLSEDLRLRAKVANDTDGDGIDDFADAFISIHFNANADPSANGTDTFYQPSVQFGDGLARKILDELIPTLQTRDRGVKEKNLGVLRQSPTVPGTLVEMAFISHAPDLKIFSYRENITKSALAIANGVVEYFKDPQSPQLPNPKLVMIPGWGGDPEPFQTMIQVLDDAGLDIIDFDDNQPGIQALRYDATLDGGDLDTAALANQVEEQINARTEPGEKVNIIAYSYGGIISRYLIEAGPSDDNIDDTWAARVDKLFMHGTPNRGTTIAYIGAINILNDDWAASAADMQPNSPLLNALGYSEPLGEEYITFGGDAPFLLDFDGVVSDSSPQLDGSDHYEIVAHHQELITLPNVIDIVLRELGYTARKQGTNLNIFGDQTTVQIEYFDIISDNGLFAEEYSFDIYVDKDGIGDNFELIDTLTHKEDGPFTWNPGENGPTTVSFELPGTSYFMNIRVEVRVDETTVNKFYFDDILYSEDIDGVRYYSYSAPDASGDGDNELRISVSGFTSDPSKVGQVTTKNIQGLQPLGINPQVNAIQLDIAPIIGTIYDKFRPFIEVGKLVYWLSSKLGGFKNAKDFLENFPIETAVDDLLEAIHLAAGRSYPNVVARISQFSELVKGVLNGTVTTTSVANSIIDSITASLTSLNAEYQHFVGKILKFIIAKIANEGTPLRALISETLTTFIQEGVSLFLSSLSDTTRQSIENILSFLIPGVVSILSVLKESPSLASIVASTVSLTAEEALEEARDLAGQYLGNLVNEVLGRIPQSLLTTTQVERLSMILGELPLFLLTLVSSSFETEASFTGIIRSLGLFTINVVMERIRSALTDAGIDNFAVFYFVQLAESLFEGLVEDKFNVNLPSVEQVVKDLTPFVLDQIRGVVSPQVYAVVEFFIKLIPDAINFFQDGIGWLINELKKWIASVLTDILDNLFMQLTDLFADYQFFSVGGELPIGLGPFVLFELLYSFEITANLEFDRVGLRDFILSVLLDGNRILSDFDISSVIKKILSFLRIAPVISGSFGIKQIATSEGGIFQILLELLGFNIEFNGFAYFSILIFELGANGFNSKSFLKVLAWGLEISIRVFRDITILDLFTGGLGGGFISRLAKFIGLDFLIIRLQFGISLRILMRADTPTTSASGIAILTFLIEAGIRLSIGIDLFIVGAKLTFYAGIRLLLTFDQDFLRRDKPLRIIFRILIILEAKIKIKLLFKTKTIRFGTVLEPFGPFDLSPKSRDDVLANGGLGYDDDYDGIPDEYERQYPGLNVGGFGGFGGLSTLSTDQGPSFRTNVVDPQSRDPNPEIQKSSVDTDGDGLTDKEELKFILTDPTITDTDGDGLFDSVEVSLFSNPLKADSDYDSLTDFEELVIYGTDPLNSDTDQDGLTDYFEITHTWNMTGITPNVPEVIIGGVVFQNHTDPLNPDTDGDLLFDGQEGFFGPFYGGDLTYDPFFPDSTDLVFNGGYTHPLDNDTDDDSYMQAYDGQILPSRVYLGDMRDGIEVYGTQATFVEHGDYIERTFYTDPTRADSDGDTGPGGVGVVMVSDGYELYYPYNLEEPTDPLSGDADNDGLRDIFEAGNATDMYDPDSDNDGLNDRLEVLLGANPNHPDSDKDGLLDGDEYQIYGTILTAGDTDFDGLLDGQEVNLLGSSPHLQDSDSDGSLDGEEVDLGTSPLGVDADGDGLPDRNELFIYLTDPFDADTDDDGLTDFDEIFTYRTSPLDRDTDRDSIVAANGQILVDMGDYIEVTGATDPNSPDTDSDGLSDGEEVLLGTSLNPLGPIAVDPTSSDTDDDRLEDGEEVQITIFDDAGLTIIEVRQPNNSSAVNPDTDDDRVDDWTEVFNGTAPNDSDTDDDFIGDFDEYYTYRGVSPIEADTDGDAIIDSLELLENQNGDLVHHPGVPFVQIASSGIMDVIIDPALIPQGLVVQNVSIQYYNTLATQADTDGDLLPDGIELIIYKPNFPSYTPELGGEDTNNNGVIDGLDLDLDDDGLEDGLEYSGEFPTTEINEWAVFDRDTDKDTLLDGEEVYTYNTRPNDTDTDDDGYSDGFEVLIGSDPLQFTSDQQIQDILAQIRFPVLIISPTNEKEYLASNGVLDVVVFNITDLHSAWYRYRATDGAFGNNVSLTYTGATDPGLWYNMDVQFSDGVYILQAFGRTMDGVLFSDAVLFSVNATIDADDRNAYGNTPVIIAISGGAATTTVSSVLIYRRMRL